MKPRTASIIGGIFGLIIGVLFLSDISGAPIFAALVLGFVSYEATWALSTIGDTSAIETRNTKDEKRAKAKKEQARKKKAARNKAASSDNKQDKTDLERSDQ